MMDRATIPGPAPNPAVLQGAAASPGTAVGAPAAAHAEAIRFAQAHLQPHAARWAQGRFERQALFAPAGAAGLLGLQLPRAWGGTGLSFTAKARVLQALAGTDFGAAMALVNSHNVATQLVQWSPDGLARSHVANLLAGRTVACTALTEPGAGSDLAQLQTTAVQSGNGWLLNGSKTWIINAAHADHVVVYAQTEPGTGVNNKGVKGMAAFWVDARAKGFARTPLSTASSLSSMGLGGFTLTDVWCDSAQLVCPPGEAFADIMAAINRARTYVAAMCCGMVAQALAEVRAWGRERQAFGKPLERHQGWRWQLAQAATALQAGELLVQQACALIDQGAGASQGADVQTAAAQAKLYATQMAQTHLGALLHAMGAEGFLDRYAFLRHLTAAHTAALTDGSTAMLLERLAQDRN